MTEEVRSRCGAYCPRSTIFLKGKLLEGFGGVSKETGPEGLMEFARMREKYVQFAAEQQDYLYSFARMHE
jgi:hypothetical protein